MYKNLKITFSIVTEMITPQYPIPFEALLMKAKSLEMGRIGDEALIDIPLPLEKKGDLYLASMSIIEASGYDEQFYTKRWRGEVPDHIDIQRGFFKAYKNRLYTLFPPTTVSFYARGDKEEIELLLTHIHYIGRKRSQGYGKVEKIRLEEIHEDRSWVYQNRPMRAIPVSLMPERTNDWYYGVFQLTPPSFKADSLTLCYLPREEDWLIVHKPKKVDVILEEKLQLKEKRPRTKKKIWGDEI